MKNEMPSLLLDEKICFIRLPLDTVQNFWQIITLVCGVSIAAVLVIFATFLWLINQGRSCAGNVCHLLVVHQSREELGRVFSSFLSQTICEYNNFLLPYVEAFKTSLLFLFVF
jgi:hypothetical protein